MEGRVEIYPDDLDQTSSNAGFPCWNLDFAIYIICSNNISFLYLNREWILMRF